MTEIQPYSAPMVAIATEPVRVHQWEMNILPIRDFLKGTLRVAVAIFIALPGIGAVAVI